MAATQRTAPAGTAPIAAAPFIPPLQLAAEPEVLSPARERLAAAMAELTKLAAQMNALMTTMGDTIHDIEREARTRR